MSASKKQVGNIEVFNKFRYNRLQNPEIDLKIPVR